MIKHYLKVAFRNLWKYKTQNIISAVGLAVGFTCFSLSMVWMKYERDFHDFHPNADRIYRIYGLDKEDPNYLSETLVHGSLDGIKEKYPEIEEITYIQMGGDILFAGEEKKRENWILAKKVDSSFFKVFSVSSKYIKHYNTPTSTIITDASAKKLSGNRTNVMGRRLKSLNYDKDEFEVVDIIPAWPKGDYFTDFDAITPKYTNWTGWGCYTFVLLKKGTDVDSFQRKIEKEKYAQESTNTNRTLKAVSIKDMRPFESNYNEGGIKYNNIKTFALLGSIIVLCAFLNYMILFVSRIKIRGAEMGLRKANGASDTSFLLLFGYEIVGLLFLSISLGAIILYFTIPSFTSFFQTPPRNAWIYTTGLIYAFFLTISVLLVSIIPLQYYKKKTLGAVIKKQTSNRSNNSFYRVSTLIQLVITMFFILCTIVFIKQIEFLRVVDLGYNRNNIVTLSYESTSKSPAYLSPLIDNIKNAPGVSDAILFEYDFMWQQGYLEIKDWDNKHVNEPLTVSSIEVTPEYFAFYKFQFLEGEPPVRDKIETYDNKYYINEAALHLLGWDKGLVKKIEDKLTIGVIKNTPNQPKEKAEPLVISIIPEVPQYSRILYRYLDGKKEIAEESIKNIIEQVYSGGNTHFEYKDETIELFLQNEKAFLKILRIATFVCIIISIFGIYSMVSLTCAKRRKEIAIRKVNGATAQSVFFRLLKEYVVLNVLAAIIALPVGYKIMSDWLEGYVLRTEIGGWIYVSIFAGILLVTTFTVFSQVWRAANLNPAEVLKSE